jgi:hypothetical protein
MTGGPILNTEMVSNNIIVVLSYMYIDLSSFLYTLIYAGLWFISIL